MKRSLFFHALLLIAVCLTIIAASIGVFTTSYPAPHTVVNQYGDTVRLYGSGIYAHDSFFRAPIFRGTDLTMLFVACPLLLITLWLDRQRHSAKTVLLLVSLAAVFVYYAASIALGVTYNNLHLLYILLFSASFFGLIAGLQQPELHKLQESMQHGLPYKSISVFLIITGVALFGAWLPDILAALAANRPPALIETYTTEVTNVLDMGVIAPLCFLCLYQLKKRSALGYVLLDLLLTLCLIIGAMLPVQTVFQLHAGIQIPLAVLLTKAGSFCLLAVFALFFKLRLYKCIRLPARAAKKRTDLQIPVT